MRTLSFTTLLLPLLIACGGEEDSASLVETSKTEFGALSSVWVANANDTPLQWTGSYTAIDEAAPGNTTDAITDAVSGHISCFRYGPTVVPDGAVITSVKLTPYAKRLAGSGTGLLKLGFKFDGGTVTWSGNYSLTSGTYATLAPANLTANTIKSPSTTMSMCVQNAANISIAVSRLEVVLTYTNAALNVNIIETRFVTSTHSIQSTVTCTDNSDNETGFDWEYSYDGSAWSSAGSTGANVCQLTLHSSQPELNQAVQYRVRAKKGAAFTPWALSAAGRRIDDLHVEYDEPSPGYMRFWWDDVDTGNDYYDIQKRNDTTLDFDSTPLAWLPGDEIESPEHDAIPGVYTHISFDGTGSGSAYATTASNPFCENTICVNGGLIVTPPVVGTISTLPVGGYPGMGAGSGTQLRTTLTCTHPSWYLEPAVFVTTAEFNGAEIASTCGVTAHVVSANLDWDVTYYQQYGIPTEGASFGGGTTWANTPPPTSFECHVSGIDTVCTWADLVGFDPPVSYALSRLVSGAWTGTYTTTNHTITIPGTLNVPYHAFGISANGMWSRASLNDNP